MQNKEKIIQILSTYLKSELDVEFTSDLLNSQIQDVGINSITYIKLLVTFENEFDFEFDDEILVITAFPTIQEMIEYISEKI